MAEALETSVSLGVGGPASLNRDNLNCVGLARRKNHTIDTRQPQSPPYAAVMPLARSAVEDRWCRTVTVSETTCRLRIGDDRKCARADRRRVHVGMVNSSRPCHPLCTRCGGARARLFRQGTRGGQPVGVPGRHAPPPGPHPPVAGRDQDVGRGVGHCE